ncbi:sigma-54-dependent Fis family transcriptional regulator [Chromobacterium sp. IIBBL 290-4]|uniref:sigma-54-dependent Fis family transcriptional regulator n=1 Tax=Chromobacterium sp. IIBBL 290-4 TaxID=2953890 RepID=UPI0020B84FD1|nr:sigma-54-dependent Fis family transcriptional regulator [Chromobacterium sp. IIBBL 290-4]UTH76069.1 sigma-54-dependent Fis family transcriptional regulator [Chromobacterium sp. IIBBL 290-4]
MNAVSRLPLDEIRRRFFTDQPLPGQALPPPILHSWQRCRGLGLPAGGGGGDKLTAMELNQRQEANQDWLAPAAPALAGLFEQVASRQLALVVADSRGLILDESGHIDFLNKAEQLALTPGMDWSEAARGTNAIGTALAAIDSVLVRGAEHYLERNRVLACAAEPLLGPQGQLLGALDISGASRKLGQPQILALQAARGQIESRLLEEAARHGWLLCLHADPRLLDAPSACKLAFDGDGRLLAANRPGLSLCGLEPGRWQARHFAALFGQSLEHWLQRHGQALGALQIGAQRFSARLKPPAAAPIASPPRAARPAQPAKAPPAAVLEPLDGAPPELCATALKQLEADIPVLILGETGTGKDRLARALHAAGSRRGQPFIAVNCAAIPEGLIEAELFGYLPGAYTGASRQGSKGRLREADGGVLFLDEIGDMPLALQARLLRVLQEREVTPLGGGPAQQLDIRLICATHRDLRAKVAEGAFRADLYYRLCHYPLSLPPLRERGDVAAIAQRMLDEMGAARRGIALSAELGRAFRGYRWPGNLRELANLLATLLALADDGAQLEMRHLPALLRADMENQGHAVPDSAIADLLRRCGGNASAAARALGISRATLYRRLGKTAK